MSEIEFGVVPEKKTKIVMDAPIARKLLKDGFKIVDIKPKRDHPRETIFVFENSAEFADKLNQYIEERKEASKKKEEE